MRRGIAAIADRSCHGILPSVAKSHPCIWTNLSPIYLDDAIVNPNP